MPALVLVLRVALGATLVFAGAVKIPHPEQLAAAIAGFRLLPAAVTAPLAVVLPYLEVLLGVYLVIGLFTRIVAWIVSVQFVVYAGAIASAVLRGIPAACGCFGPNDGAKADWPHVAMDFGFALLAAIIGLAGPGALAVDRRLRKT
ncbi:MAG TPA: MauE/DoxX family redox-associated membrane protein [Candidatus Tumulicola sp.]